MSTNLDMLLGACTGGAKDIDGRSFAVFSHDGHKRLTGVFDTLCGHFRIVEFGKGGGHGTEVGGLTWSERWRSREVPATTRLWVDEK